ncbi:MAG: glucosaminidase domain-containing protein [Saprospiraceae bacterium]|nr:glucosaminidase domain-containing protein [Saprospiraceae bacterium]
MQTEILHHSYLSQNADYQLKNKPGILQKYWFQALILALVVYILFKKDVSIEFGLSTGSVLLADASDAPSQDVASHDHIALPATYQEENPLNVSALATERKDKEKIPIANTMANLTPILSPSYAKRKGIPQEVVDQKLNICKAYIRRHAAAAIQEMHQFDIPASITLAQGLLESNAGESRLAKESNNHFGIKCRSKCAGCTCRNYSDDDIYDMFRVFNSAWESYREHSRLLNGGRYNHLKKYGNHYKNWAYGLKKAGYATDPRYAEKLIQIIEFLDLDKYDREAA